MKNLLLILAITLAGSASYAQTLKAKIVRVEKAALSPYENALGAQVQIGGSSYTSSGSYLKVNAYYYRSQDLSNCLDKAKQALRAGNGLLIEGIGSLKSLRFPDGGTVIGAPVKDGDVSNTPQNSDTYYFSKITRCTILVNSIQPMSR